LDDDGIQTLISDFFTGNSVGTVMGLSETSSTIGVLLVIQSVFHHNS